MTFEELVKRVPKEHWDLDVSLDRSFGEAENGDCLDINNVYIFQDCIVLDI